jgi:hypothetical protein
VDARLFGLGWVVANVPDRPSIAPPMVQIFSNACFGARVVAVTPTRMIDRLLQVDQQQHGAGWWFIYGADSEMVGPVDQALTGVSWVGIR